MKAGRLTAIQLIPSRAEIEQLNGHERARCFLLLNTTTFNDIELNSQYSLPISLQWSVLSDVL